MTVVRSCMHLWTKPCTNTSECGDGGKTQALGSTMPTAYLSAWPRLRLIDSCICSRRPLRSYRRSRRRFFSGSDLRYEQPEPHKRGREGSEGYGALVGVCQM